MGKTRRASNTRSLQKAKSAVSKARNAAAAASAAASAAANAAASADEGPVAGAAVVPNGSGAWMRNEPSVSAAPERNQTSPPVATRFKFWSSMDGSLNPKRPETAP